ncbi:hypothetical protein [Oligoflexus tunisiensis]|uniref:hypothetical protein n=1 Tax=Oligoflexus tunisiensis TaxID=708132 RepID=UPI00114D10AB|nr:hypothetical protein [Oligoflexus tunisiensis]
MSGQVKLDLSGDEALVLFEWLARTNSTDLAGLFEHEAEKIVSWNLEAKLEKLLSEPLEKDYKRTLEKARDRLAAAGS